MNNSSKATTQISSAERSVKKTIIPTARDRSYAILQERSVSFRKVSKIVIIVLLRKKTTIPTACDRSYAILQEKSVSVGKFNE